MTNLDITGKVNELQHVESADVGKLEGLDDANLPQYHDKETMRVLRKVDWRLLPVLTFLYVLAFLDRGNIGNARVAGMNKDLGLTDQEYNLALTVQ
jgi:hypothetical protein